MNIGHNLSIQTFIKLTLRSLKTLLVCNCPTRLCLPFGDLFSDTDESIHFERHKFELHSDSQPHFVMKYYLNDRFICDINGLGLLSIEKTRTRNVMYKSDATFFAQKDSDLFTEKDWKEMKEPIPNGPQAISLDVGFGSFNSVFGIPERINSFEVKSTVEYEIDDEGKDLIKVKEEEPFRLFTCDHFNDKYPNHS